jgi:hypothetical protein
MVIGIGPEARRLQEIAGPTVTIIAHNLTDKALVRYYQNCRAFLYAGDEDFGIVAAEAQACGKPVIAYKESGVSEIVKDKKTGILFGTQSVQDLERAIIEFEGIKISPSACRENVLKFDTQKFRTIFKDFVEEKYRKVKVTT